MKFRITAIVIAIMVVLIVLATVGAETSHTDQRIDNIGLIIEE